MNKTDRTISDRIISKVINAIYDPKGEIASK
jgi:hypothetical protein